MNLIELPPAMKQPYGLTAVYLKQLFLQLKLSPPILDTRLKDCMIDTERLNNDRFYRVPFYKLSRFLDLPDDSLHEPAAHINAVFSLRVKSFPLIGYAVASSPTLRNALEQLIRLEPVVWDVGHIHQEQTGKNTRLIWTPHTDISSTAIEMAIAGWVSIGQQLFPTERHPDSVSFTHDRPRAWTQYQKLFGCPVLFNAKVNSIEFPSRWLDEKLVDGDDALAEMVIGQANALIEGYRQTLNLENELRAILFQHLPQEPPDLGDIAKLFGVSTRKMRALLSTRNLSYRQIVDDVRKEVARHLLLQPACSMGDVAGFCGFLEQSSFNRAFKRWFDCAPSDYLTQVARKHNSQLF